MSYSQCFVHVFLCDNEVRNLILPSWLIHCVKFVEYVLFFCFILVFVIIV
jgi:hypothetical protein